MQTQVDATFIDGLWLMSANVPSPEASYKNAQSITKDLIASAKKLNVPVVLMHQYASGYSARVQSTRREVKRPNIGDFADGRHATRNPHVVIGMHRPDLYGSADDDNVTEGLMQAFIIKNRNASGVDNEPVNLIFDKVTSSYREPRTRHVDLAE
jgi:replicative DNA helicase